jgi:hypothetical protein
MQWNLRQIGDARDVVVEVPDEAPLHVPAGFAEDQARFDRSVQALSQGLRDQATPAQIERSLRRIDGVVAGDAAAMAGTFVRLRVLYDSGKNGIWPFVLRNLMRPLWLSRPDQRADVLIGNPPWVAYRYLSAEMRPRLRDACVATNLWVGGRLATNQDLSALFWARGAERYLGQGGTIAFVLPFAALNRPAFDGLRGGDFNTAQVHIIEAWDLARVRPLFGRSGTTSASVLFGRREPTGPLPRRAERFSGVLSRRDATETEADAQLIRTHEPWPPITTLEGASLYRDRFRQGANFIPRRFFLVEREPASRLGDNPATPRVHGKISSIDRPPWRDIDPPRGAVEVQFLRPLLLGENIGPFRLLGQALAVVPAEDEGLLDAVAAANAGNRFLAGWMRDIEAKWTSGCNKRADGTPRMTLIEQIDHMHKLSNQLSVTGIKIVYNKAGTRLSAATLDNPQIIVDTMAYWAVARSLDEARYLTVVLNSTPVLSRIVGMQPRGASGPRHFDLLPWELPVPEYAPDNTLHRQLTQAAERAEVVAAAVPLREGTHFTRQRREIRDALTLDGIANRLLNS